ncbi:MAG TPA: DUF932 domain-containing protein [Stellaceae bacterium]|jgi:hypothetical protein|nr:DUF932 domain-containing protein [Stellaceae bacterium]
MLILHAGANEIDYDGLRQLETPDPTATHVPVPHFRVVDMLRHTLGFYGHTVVSEKHGVTPDGMRYFGLLQLRSPHTGHVDSVGLRNSHDRSFPIGIGLGAVTLVCDNLSFLASTVIKRKHTVNARRDLPGLVAEVVEPLTEQREAQARKFEHYRTTELSDMQSDHCIVQLYKQGVIGVQRIADVLKEYDEPSFDEFRTGPRNAWRLFNSTTFALNGRIAENPASTARLHQVIDGVCEHIN